MKTETALAQVLTQLNRERENYTEFGSPHEVHAFIQEHQEDLWQAIKRGESKTVIRAKAKQLAVTAMRMMTDCT